MPSPLQLTMFICLFVFFTEGGGPEGRTFLPRPIYDGTLGQGRGLLSGRRPYSLLWKIVSINPAVLLVGSTKMEILLPFLIRVGNFRTRVLLSTGPVQVGAENIRDIRLRYRYIFVQYRASLQAVSILVG